MNVTTIKNNDKVYMIFLQFIHTIDIRINHDGKFKKPTNKKYY